jgi:septum formation protein
MFRTVKPLILASGSPRRKQLLESMGLAFEVRPASRPEPEFMPGRAPAEHAQLAATLKAREVAEHFSGPVVLAADTIVVLDGEVLGKPRDGGEALAMLVRLAGREHQVITGCCLLFANQSGIDDIENRFVLSTRVWMADFGPEILAGYIDTGEPLDKAGAYGIQERAAFLVERIEGSYTNVVGLPLSETIRFLLQRGVVEGNITRF